MSTFSQKHYEHVMRELSRMTEQQTQERGFTLYEIQSAAGVIARIFERDNPKFKWNLFMKGAKQHAEGNA